MTLLAHHLEHQHLPVLAVFVVVGFWMGWRVVSLALNRRELAKGASSDAEGDPLRD